MARVVSNRRATRVLWTCLLYFASVIGATAFYRGVQRQPVEGIGSFLILSVGPVIAVRVYRRPPSLLVPTALFIPYYAVIAVSIASESDESRWSYSRMGAGAFYLVIQLVAAWIVFSIYRRPAHHALDARGRARPH